MNYNTRYSTKVGGKNILIDENSINNKNFTGFNSSESKYSYIKSPFIVNTASISTTIKNIYDTSLYYDSSICSPFAQFNYQPVDKTNSIFNAYSTSVNEVNNGIFNFGLESFSSFNQKNINYNYNKDSVSYNDSIVNVGYNYSNNENFYKDTTCDMDLIKDIIDNNNVQYYVIQEDNIIDSESFPDKPMEITLYEPIKYLISNNNTEIGIYIHNGGFKPIFNNILNFGNNEASELINIVEKDFILSNTNTLSYNGITQYWHNKVVDKVRVNDTSNNIAFLTNRSPFLSLWDGDYYKLDTNTIDSYVDGFNSSLELPSFFGSKTISLPDQLILDKWNSSNTNLNTLEDEYILEYNLTKTILDLFTSTIKFIENWNNLPNVSDDIINRYIIKTVLNTYNISINKIDIEVLSKLFNAEILAYNKDDQFKEKYENFKSSLSLINDEYIYKISIPKDINKSFFTTFTFNKK